MIVEVFLLVVFVLVLYRQTFQRPKNFPPGPRGLPLVGYTPFLAKNDFVFSFRGLVKLSEIYGPVVGFYLGPSKPFISVCGYKAVKEALRNEYLDGRSITPAILDRSFGKRLGIVFTEGQFWRNQRQFTLHHLRNLGLGKTSTEGLMQEEIQTVLHHLASLSASSPDRIVDLKGIFTVSVLNLLWIIIAGERFQQDDPCLKLILEVNEKFFKTGDTIRSNIAIPQWWLKHLPFVRKFQGNQTDLLKNVQDVVRTTIEEHEERRDINDAPATSHDFIDVYLNEINLQSSDKTSTFQKDQLISVILDLLSAGFETTSHLIGYTILYLLHNPKVQQKMQAELDLICGNNLATLAQKSSLPYTEAVLMEGMRLSNITPLTVSHCALKDTELLGYTIPKDSVLSMNIYSVHMDATFWKDPEVFRPERHLDNDGRIIRNDHLIPFGVGKRICMGESFTRNSFYSFVTAIVKNYVFEKIADQPFPTTEPRNGFTLGYQGFTAVVTPRY